MAEQAEVVAVEAVDINDVANEATSQLLLLVRPTEGTMRLLVTFIEASASTSSCSEDISIRQLAIRATKLFPVVLSSSIVLIVFVNLLCRTAGDIFRHF